MTFFLDKAKRFDQKTLHGLSLAAVKQNIDTNWHNRQKIEQQKLFLLALSFVGAAVLAKPVFYAVKYSNFSYYFFEVSAFLAFVITIAFTILLSDVRHKFGPFISHVAMVVQAVAGALMLLPVLQGNRGFVLTTVLPIAISGLLIFMLSKNTGKDLLTLGKDSVKKAVTEAKEDEMLARAVHKQQLSRTDADGNPLPMWRYLLNVVQASWVWAFYGVLALCFLVLLLRGVQPTWPWVLGALGCGAYAFYLHRGGNIIFYNYFLVLALPLVIFGAFTYEGVASSTEWRNITCSEYSAMSSSKQGAIVRGALRDVYDNDRPAATAEASMRGHISSYCMIYGRSGTTRLGDLDL